MEKEMNFETAIDGLERCVRELEEGSLTLEETLARYEEGKRYAKTCYELLENAELKIVELKKDSELIESEERDADVG
jgi:exodeoxyribonuclease VII small subunit